MLGQTGKKTQQTVTTVHKRNIQLLHVFARFASWLFQKHVHTGNFSECFRHTQPAAQVLCGQFVDLCEQCETHTEI